jgi:hypothetical protein
VSCRRARRALAAATLALVSTAASAADLNCRGPANVEEFNYTWRLRGGISWIAGLIFPTSGVGQLKTSYPSTPDDHDINSTLLITSAGGKSGFYVYETRMEEGGRKTLMTYHGYAWGKKSRKERTIFDYVKRLAHIHKETPEKQWDRVEPMPPDTTRDILTAIHYLRQNADKIRGPMQTSIYSDGREYSVIFRPAERRVFTIGAARVPALGFEIVDAPGGRKWPGGIKVWISDDARRIPFEIDIQESMASLQLELRSIESCAFLQASK